MKTRMVAEPVYEGLKVKLGPRGVGVQGLGFRVYGLGVWGLGGGSEELPS